MSLTDWQANGWLKPHATSKEEINNLLRIVERDLSDSIVSGLSADWQFGIAYNAALKLCTIALYTQGYRPENSLAHYRTIASLKEIPERNWSQYAAYLNACRMRRNTLEYDRADIITSDEANNLITFTKTFLIEIKLYLADFFPDYVSNAQ